MGIFFPQPLLLSETEIWGLLPTYSIQSWKCLKGPCLALGLIEKLRPRGQRQVGGGEQAPQGKLLLLGCVTSGWSKNLSMPVLLHL